MSNISKEKPKEKSEGVRKDIDPLQNIALETLKESLNVQDNIDKKAEEISINESKQKAENITFEKATIKKKLNNIFGKDSYNKSIKIRGGSYIDATRIIIENHLKLSGLSEQQIKNHVAIKNIEILRNFWNSTQTYEKENLRALLRALTEEIQVNVYPFKKEEKSNKNFKKENEKLLKKILKKDLAHAENHATWEKYHRSDLKTIIKSKDKEGNLYFQVRIDVPITILTKDQEKEWYKILDVFESNQPKWFKSLPEWERKYLQDRLRKAIVQRDENVFENIKRKQKNEPLLPENLGELLGVPPTTIRGYPGARNCYKSYFYNFVKNQKNPETFEFKNKASKIRSGHISPDLMQNDQERLNNSINNIKQLILSRAQDMINNGKKEFIFDLQTLVTPPFDRTMDKMRLDSVDKIRADFSDSNKFISFLNENGIVDAEGKKLSQPIQLTLLTSNYPTNEVRTIANFLNAITALVLMPFGMDRRNRENNKVINKLKELASNKSDDPTINMGKKALTKLLDISGPIQRISNFFKRGINHNVERAALEQIALSALGGERIGSCMSGKDREGGVSEHMAAMIQYYSKYNEFPPIPGTLTRRLNAFEKERRIEYEMMVAEQFLSGHEQKIAEANAPGCSGLKSISTILGKNVINAANKIAKELDPSFKNLGKDSIKTASLNRQTKLVSSTNPSYETLNKQRNSVNVQTVMTQDEEPAKTTLEVGPKQQTNPPLIKQHSFQRSKLDLNTFISPQEEQKNIAEASKSQDETDKKPDSNRRL